MATQKITQKPIHTIVLDAGGIIKNEPPVSTLLAQSEELVTTPAIISEIRDAATRSRVEATLQPFLTLRQPGPASIKTVTEFARRTGDLAVLSKPDVQIIALAYELECERNGGDWRLRRVPGQKGLNGTPPKKVEEEQGGTETETQAAAVALSEQAPLSTGDAGVSDSPGAPPDPQDKQTIEVATLLDEQAPEPVPDPTTQELVEQLSNTTLSDQISHNDDQAQAGSASDNDSDSDGWITHSNLKSHQAASASGIMSNTNKKLPRNPIVQTTLQVATLTSDFAMQNVLLQMNLNLLSPTLHRVRRLKTFVKRCHACFATTKETQRDFCPRCGQPTLTRVACSTDAATGATTLHLKKNMQWNHRGDRFSVPKSVAGSANGRVKGAGKGAWGHGLVFAEDQKEYARAVEQEGRRSARERDLMDEDYLPAILSGRSGPGLGTRIKVGAGRNVNSRKR
ncbi:20S-pre-rRNA D-site endonuclease nob1 [Elasticomyces elasticus]|nr:20S-pre-rRNA D-site endonuclease nob1 [Elasticomyces elasticus]